MLLGLYFLMVIALPLTLGAYVLYRGLPRTRRCPLCAAETFRLKSRRHDLFSRLLPVPAVHLRWCPSCGWEGAARADRTPRPAPAGPHPLHRNRLQAVAERDADRVDLRSLEVDGATWRVMVECWAEGGRWLARLVFVAPGGQVWPDERSLEGTSVLAVLSQAFSLPEHTLAGRLRRSIR